MTLLPHQQRVVKEKQDLDENLSRLKLFFDTDTFQNISNVEQVHLKRQATAMSLYSEVLGERIAWFHANEQL